MKAKKKTKEPEIVAVEARDGLFFIKYRQGKKEWIEAKPYTTELYKQLLPYLGYA